MPQKETDAAAREAFRLAEILVARLCHDLSGPAGTITNALDLIQEGGDTAAEALAIALDGSAQLTRRLRLLRAAWAGGDTSLTPVDVLGLIEGLRSGRIKVDLSALPQTEALAPTVARLILALLLLAEECLPRGGRVALAGDPANDLVMLIEGPAASWPAGMTGWVSDATQAQAAMDGMTPRLGPLVALMAHAQGARLSFLLAGHAGAEGPPPLRVSVGRSGALSLKPHQG